MKVKILVVDDEKSIADSLKELVCLMDEECDKANSIEEAIEKIKNKKYDVILLDILLNGQTCEPIIQYVKSLGPDRPSIVLMSAMVRNQARDFADENNIEDLLYKPFDLDIIEKYISLH